MRRVLMLLIGVLALAGLAVAIGGAWLLSRGISARPEPPALEAAMAHRLRALAIPAAAMQRPNPVASDPKVIVDGLAHFADHCASCHGNDGGGQTTMGRGLYPRAPDLRLPGTQQLSDGMLFYIIENGVKLTGMPAWGNGTAESEADSWKLVHFIRHLPALTEAERLQMEALNPKSDDEWRETEEEKRFLEGAQK
jgi:mono/diheme cytochrome c family protein